MSLNERRHHQERLKKKRQRVFGALSSRQLGILTDTPKRCSCLMCRNRRQDEGETVQERIKRIARGRGFLYE